MDKAVGFISLLLALTFKAFLDFPLWRPYGSLAGCFQLFLGGCRNRTVRLTPKHPKLDAWNNRVSTSVGCKKECIFREDWICHSSGCIFQLTFKSLNHLFESGWHLHLQILRSLSVINRTFQATAYCLISLCKIVFILLMGTMDEENQQNSSVYVKLCTK